MLSFKRSSNFRVLDRKFTQEEVKQFNARRQIMNAPHRKWIFNEYVYTPEEFLKLTQNAETKLPPWKQCSLSLMQPKSLSRFIVKILIANWSN